MVDTQFTFPSTVVRRENRQDGRTAEFGHWKRYCTFYGLVLTTTLSSVLLAADLFKWRVTGYFFILANKYPASVALTVQLLAAFFGLIHVAVISRLINYALRLRLNKTTVTLDALRTWVDMSLARVDWDLPLRFFFPVMLVVFLSLVPAALWAGSITPLISRTTTTGTLLLPSYEDVSLIREYPMEIGKSGPSLRNNKGFFTYSVGIGHLGSLLSSAASASSLNSVHPKLDNTQFSYRGRSYGVGAPAGLTDSRISSNRQVAGYIYQEEGYLTNISCIYNATTDFTLKGPMGDWIYEASGRIPDTVENPEMSNYIGHDGKAIVAIGVSYSERSPRRYLSITAGESYAFLNSTQCEFTFTPTLFNVTVDISNLNITVRPIADSTIPDFNPSRNLTRTVVRQFELMSNDLTNLYVSLLGEAFNSSIAAYNMTHLSTPRNPIPESVATLEGLTNSLVAMTDDMLAAYASAQLIVGKIFTPATSTVHLYALQFGQPGYVYSIFVLNLVVLAAVVAEWTRTRGWRELGRWNYLDPRDLIVAASRGGKGLSGAADRLGMAGSINATAGGGDVENAGVDGIKAKRRLRKFSLLSDYDEGNGQLPVCLRGDADGHVSIVLAGEYAEDRGRRSASSPGSDEGGNGNRPRRLDVSDAASFYTIDEKSAKLDGEFPREGPPRDWLMKTKKTNNKGLFGWLW
ncbi:hypothetical protein BU24DRAFT_85234 [Aaosphaeria arxii CBS 175.79]|uniref:Uncharacterized protein n=1 Tax=Aaosphaeria arxii CBS 175.79 TaxID=1450172 RepID=A0A6A5X856_9PLEO|nr:uncharacterized protein BU24DRAFT_85234 [Aaosphaeria arxii CBS 175.79]KAF2009225.1 hypothetical protein BU24DRAFT_85234 [Aaosphaeria arxii CBS 175.79]